MAATDHTTGISSLAADTAGESYDPELLGTECVTTFLLTDKLISETDQSESQ